jgi:hypothetical protein
VVSQKFEDRKPEITGSHTKDVAVLKKPAHLSQEFCPEILGGSNYEIIGFEPEKRPELPSLNRRPRCPSSISLAPSGRHFESFLRVESLFFLRFFLDFFSQKALICWLS